MAVDFILRQGKPPQFISEPLQSEPPPPPWYRQMPWGALAFVGLGITQLVMGVTLYHQALINSYTSGEIDSLNKSIVQLQTTVLGLQKGFLQLSVRVEALETAAHVVPTTVITPAPNDINKASLDDVKAAIELQQSKLDAVLDGLKTAGIKHRRR